MNTNGDKKFWAGALTLSGTMIGAGMLGLPFVIAKSGFLIGLLWILFLGAIMLFVHLYMGEVVLRTHGKHQLTGYAEHYLGKFGKIIMLFAVLFGIYAALVGYLIGEGESFSYLIMGDAKYAIFFGVVFWLVLTLLLREGFRELKKFARFTIPIVLLAILGVFFYLIPQARFSNLSTFNTSMFFVPLGVVLFSMLGFSAIPEVGRVMQGRERSMKKALIIGTLLPITLYIIFALTFVGVFGPNVQEVATLSLGRIGSLIGIATMITAYFILSFALKDTFEFDLNVKKSRVFFLVSIVPLILYILISLFGFLDFVSVLGIGGVISGGITGILILLMNNRAKKYSERKPEYWIPINWAIIILVSLVFIAGVVIELGILKV
jgi:amino acid permease